MKTQILNRRRFLRQATLAAGGIAAWPASTRAAQGATTDIRVAVTGFGNKGKQPVQLFSALPGVRIVALSEPDSKRLAAEADKLKQKGNTPFTAADARRVRERDDVDAVVVATPIQEGHVSSAVCHLGNISYRLDNRAGCGPARRRSEPGRRWSKGSIVWSRASKASM